jgi:hypothetical protein
VEERTKIVTTNFTVNQLIQFSYIFECVELNLPSILNLIKNAHIHAIFNTFVGYDFIRMGIHRVSSKPDVLRGGNSSVSAALKNNHS